MLSLNPSTKLRASNDSNNPSIVRQAHHGACLSASDMRARSALTFAHMSLRAHFAIAKHPERKQSPKGTMSPLVSGDCFVAVDAPRNDMIFIVYLCTPSQEYPASHSLRGRCQRPKGPRERAQPAKGSPFAELIGFFQPTDQFCIHFIGGCQFQFVVKSLC
jgi:hypothetical protein